TPHRERYLGMLKRDMDILHIDHGWPSRVRARNVDDFLQMVGSFTISLNIHAENEMSWEPRLQTMLACGALVVSEPITPNPHLKPGLHFVEIDNPGKLYETCKDILAN